MGGAENASFPNLSLSHIELYVKDISRMESFYTEVLGFIVTDRGEGDGAMVFLSRNPNEHHQLVLNPRPSRRSTESPVDHISFRVQSLAQLRVFCSSLQCVADLNLQTVSHGNSWSIYFRDPEGNRFEIFADTPWHVNQPCKFAVDFNLTDEELIAFTKHKVEGKPGYALADEWQSSHSIQLKSEYK